MLANLCNGGIWRNKNQALDIGLGCNKGRHSGSQGFPHKIYGQVILILSFDMKNQLKRLFKKNDFTGRIRIFPIARVFKYNQVGIKVL